MNSKDYLPVSFALPYVVLFGIVAYACYRLSLPILRPVISSIVLVTFVYPVYVWIRKLFRGKFLNITAFIATALMVLLIVFPGIVIAFAITTEATTIYDIVTEVFNNVGKIVNIDISKHLPPFVNQMLAKWIGTPWGGGIIDIKLGDFLMRLGQWISSYIVTLSRNFIANTLKLFYELFVITVVSFYLFRDGEKILRFSIELLPLDEDERKEAVDRMKQMIHGILYGTILTSLVQAVLGGIGFIVTGIPSPVFFGVIMFFTSMIPFVGTPVVWVPAAIYLFIIQQPMKAVFLFLWGLLVVSLVDNFLKPIFISGGSKTHLLIVFIGILGGLPWLGFIGIFVGPLIVAFFIFMLESYHRRVRGWR